MNADLWTKTPALLQGLCVLAALAVGPGEGGAATERLKTLRGPLALICHSAAGSSCHCLLAPFLRPLPSELKLNPYTHTQ